MKTLQVPEAKKIVQAYLDGYVTVKEMREKLEPFWDMKIHRGTKAPGVERPGVPMLPILTQDRPVRKT
jgi:hypothetical protein